MSQGGVLIVSNRLPVTIKRQAGGLVVERSIGGLATALNGVVKRGGVRWVGWTGLEQTVPDAKLRQAGLGDNLIPVQITPELVEGYYDNASNRTLWPVMHGMDPGYRARTPDWAAYEAVNRQFADVVGAAVQPQDVIWIQDYHLFLLPKYLRAKGVKNKIGLFVHVPFPPPAAWSKLPGATELLGSLADVDLLGVQTERDVTNFVACTRAVGAAQPHRVGFYPIGVDFEAFNTAHADGMVQKATERIRQQAAGRKIVFSLSRLDYTKGIQEQLRAVERFLVGNPKREDFVYRLVVAPSRERVNEYRQLRDEIEHLAETINKTLGNESWQPVHYTYQSIGFEEVVANYLVADALLLLPVVDGMNLVAKEYVATRQKPPGRVVLSQNAGVAFQFSEALLVAPDEVAAATALSQAFNMTEAEAKRRWHSMRTSAKDHNIFWWADRFLDVLTSQ